MDESSTTTGSVGSAGDDRSNPGHGPGDGPRDAMPDAAADENAADGDAASLVADADESAMSAGDADASAQRDAAPQGTVPDVAPTAADASAAGGADTSDANVTPVGDTGSRDVDDDTAVDPDLLARAEALADLPLAERADAFDRLNGDVQAALRAIEET